MQKVLLIQQLQHLQCKSRKARTSHQTAVISHVDRQKKYSLCQFSYDLYAICNCVCNSNTQVFLDSALQIAAKE